MLNRQHHLSILCFIVLFLLLYFGCDTKSTSHMDIEKSRSTKIEAINVTKLVNDTRKTLMVEEKARVDYLMLEYQNASDSLKNSFLEKLSSEWYQLGHPIISAFYAKELASKKNDEQTWSIAGTSFAIGLRNTTDQDQRKYALSNAVAAFENALSLNPENIDHKINLALCYTEQPPEDNPMKGVLMMVDLNKKNPNNIKVLSQLAILSLKTNQIDRAINRCEQILALDPDYNDAHCMLAQIYTSNKELEKASGHIAKCNKN